MVLAAIAAIVAPVAASADVTVKFPEGKADSIYVVEHMLISDQVRPRAERPQPVADTLKSVGGIMKFELDAAGPARYMIPFGGPRQGIDLYAAPGENLAVIVSSESPLEYVVTGSKLMDGITDLKQKSGEIIGKYQAAANATPRDEAGMEAAQNAYSALFKDYMTANPENPASLYALLNMDGEDFMNAYAALSDALKSTALFPLVENQKTYVEKSIEADKKMQELQSGNVDAPNFTLKNLEGKDVSLSDFRGKWVIIDFWGSWCGWCIKGFPKLKDAYEQYKPELEILGVDCNEPEANWRKGVEKYKLPWVNVYNPADTDILTNYAVQGFPTKVIVSPEGKIANITVGENPAFFDTLAKLINGK